MSSRKTGRKLALRVADLLAGVVTSRLSAAKESADSSGSATWSSKYLRQGPRYSDYTYTFA